MNTELESTDEKLVSGISLFNQLASIGIGSRNKYEARLLKLPPRLWGTLEGAVKLRDDILAGIPENVGLICMEYDQNLPTYSQPSEERVQLIGFQFIVMAGLYERKYPFVLLPWNAIKKFVSGKGNLHRHMLLVEILERWHFKSHDEADGVAYILARLGVAMLAGYKDLPKFQEKVIEQVLKECCYYNRSRTDLA